MLDISLCSRETTCRLCLVLKGPQDFLLATPILEKTQPDRRISGWISVVGPVDTHRMALLSLGRVSDCTSLVP
jgi:hypothetical protein